MSHSIKVSVFIHNVNGFVQVPSVNEWNSFLDVSDHINEHLIAYIVVIDPYSSLNFSEVSSQNHLHNMFNDTLDVAFAILYHFLNHFKWLNRFLGLILQVFFFLNK